jgi:hypothetical protein
MEANIFALDWSSVEQVKLYSGYETGKAFMMAQTKNGAEFGIKVCTEFANNYFCGLFMSRLGIKCPQANVLSQRNQKEEFKRLLLGVDWATRADTLTRKISK